MVTEQQVNEVFDAYLLIFNELSEIEDKLEELKNDVESFKEGTAKHTAAIEAVKQFEKETLFPKQRELRRAGLAIDKIKTLVQVTRV